MALGTAELERLDRRYDLHDDVARDHHLAHALRGGADEVQVLLLRARRVGLRAGERRLGVLHTEEEGRLRLRLRDGVRLRLRLRVRFRLRARVRVRGRGRLT